MYGFCTLSLGYKPIVALHLWVQNQYNADSSHGTTIYCIAGYFHMFRIVEHLKLLNYSTPIGLASLS